VEIIHISEKRLASILKITPRYVRELFEAHRVKKGIYNFILCLEQYLSELNGKSEEVRLQKLKVDTAQFKLNVMKKEYHHTEDIEIFLGELTARIKSKILAIPNKGARLVTGETEINKVEVILKDFTDEILRDLSDYENFEILEETDEREDQKLI